MSPTTSPPNATSLTARPTSCAARPPWPSGECSQPDLPVSKTQLRQAETSAHRTDSTATDPESNALYSPALGKRPYGQGVSLEVAHEAVSAMKLAVRLPQLWAGPAATTDTTKSAPISCAINFTTCDWPVFRAGSDQFTAYPATKNRSGVQLYNLPRSTTNAFRQAEEARRLR